MVSLWRSRNDLIASILTAYWEGSPSKYFPWAVMHSAHRCCHCWKYFWNSCCGTAFNTIVVFFGCLQYPEIFVPLRQDFIFWNSQKPFGSKSGEQGGCSISVIDFWARHFLTESALWAGPLSWWGIQLLGQSSGIFCTSIFPHSLLRNNFHYGLDDRSSTVWFPAWAGNFSLHHRIQTGSGVHPASYPMSTRGFSLGVKRPKREADHSPPSSAEVKNAWSYTSTPPIRLHGVVLS
jgi:hypothetical protein